MEDIFNQIAAATRPQQASNFLNMFDEISENIPEAKGSEAEQAELEQKSFEWHLNRMEKFTGSKIPNLMKSGRGKGEEWGATAVAVILEMATLATMTEDGRNEYIMQQMRKEFVQTKWGNDNEPIARAEYEKQTGYTVNVTGFTVNPKCKFHGGSFDGEIVGEKGIIEIKCPFDPIKHIQNLNLKRNGLDSKHEYYGQIQSNIETAGADWCDFVSFDPRQDENHRLVIIRVLRDQIYIDAMMERIFKARKIYELYMLGLSIENAIKQININN